MKQTLRLGWLALFAATLLTACNDSDDTKTTTDDNTQVEETDTSPSIAFVQTVSPDYSSSEVVTIDADSKQVITGYYLKDKSDYTLVTYKDAIYHIGRYGIDTIDKYLASSAFTPSWSYSTQDNEDSVSRNPYAIAFASDEKAYVLRYGSSKVWIVNPNATQAEEFKIGELDLSSYVENNSGNTPSPAAAKVADGKLFIAMQRIDDNWSPQTAYVAVFDTNTDTEIETNASTADSVKGIPLSGVNPLEQSLYVFEDELFVTTRDSFSSIDLSGSMIEAIDTETFELRQVLQATDISDNVSASIQSSVIESAEKGYFFATRSVFEPAYHEVSTLYQFNPTTGEITAEKVAGTGEEDINFIAYDPQGYLWLSIGSDTTPGVDVIDTSSNSLFTERLLTDLNPNAVGFVQP